MGLYLLGRMRVRVREASGSGRPEQYCAKGDLMVGADDALAYSIIRWDRVMTLALTQFESKVSK